MYKALTKGSIMNKILLLLALSLTLFSCSREDTAGETTRIAESAVIAISSTNELNQILAEENKLAVIDLYADWCGPCKLIEPIISDLSTKYDSVSFVKVDVDQHQDLSRKYQAGSIPLVLFVKNGEVVERTIGAHSAADYRKLVEKYK